MRRGGSILVTGGVGLVGTSLVSRLGSLGHAVTVFDNAPPQNWRKLDGVPGVRKVVGDVRYPRDLERIGAGPWDVVFHLAAQANVPASVADPLLDFEVNADGTLRVLQWARQNEVRRFVFASTVAVYDAGSPMPLSESAPLAPSSPYGASKLAGEALVRAFGRTYGMHTVVVRLFNVYGPGMDKYVIHDLIRKLQKDSTRLEIIGDGEQVRDYLHSGDVAKALILVATKAPKDSVLNVGSGIPVRIRDLADSIIGAMGLKNVERVYTEKSWAGDIRTWYADTTRLRHLGFRPRVSLVDGLAEVVADLAEGTAR